MQSMALRLPLLAAGLLPEVLGSGRFVTAALAAFWSAANLMMALREHEARQAALQPAKA
jgi:hypothetical protein